MKKAILFLLVQLLISCTAKHKLLSKSQDHVEKRKTANTNVEMLDKHTTAIYYIDSSQYRQWLKIYPKGLVSIGNNGFIGEADSLILLKSEVSYRKNISTHKQQTQQKEKQKLSFEVWVILLVVVSLSILIHLKREGS